MVATKIEAASGANVHIVVSWGEREERRERERETREGELCVRLQHRVNHCCAFNMTYACSACSICYRSSCSKSSITATATTVTVTVAVTVFVTVYVTVTVTVFVAVCSVCVAVIV